MTSTYPLSNRTRSVARVKELEKQLEEAIEIRDNERQISNEEKIDLETKCTELQEKLEDFMAELGEVNEKSKNQELELMQFKQGKSI